MPATQTIRCPSCGAVNRVPEDKLRADLTPICGRCKKPLMIDAAPIAVTDATFSETVEQSKLPILVDMWAPWCGPCRMVTPILDELSAEMAGRVRFAKMNIDENPQTAARFRIEAIPAMLVFNGGREVDRIVGANPKQVIAQRLNKLIG